MEMGLGLKERGLVRASGLEVFPWSALCRQSWGPSRVAHLPTSMALAAQEEAISKSVMVQVSGIIEQFQAQISDL